MPYHFVGLDLSLTNTGVAVLRGDDLEGHPHLLRNVRSAPEKTAVKDGKSYAGLLDRRNRLRRIAGRIVAAALDGYDPEVDDAPVFAIELPLLLAKNGGQGVLDRAGLFWLVTNALFNHGIVIEISTTTMKKYATGSGGTPKGQDSKAAILLAIPRMFPGVFVTDDNTADALALAAMVARALGSPREPSPQRVTPSALNAVEWPSNTQRKNRNND